MSKLRMERRSQVLTFTPLYDVHDDSHLGYVADLTTKGALLISENPMDVNRVLTVGIEFREKSEIPSEDRIELPVRVAWCKMDDFQTHYNIGLEFLDVTDRNKVVIHDILKKYPFHLQRPAKPQSTAG